MNLSETTKDKTHRTSVKIVTGESLFFRKQTYEIFRLRSKVQFKMEAFGFKGKNCLRTNYSRLQVNKDGSRNVFSRSSFTEERVEGIVSSSNSFIAWHLAIRLNSVFQAVQLPTSITNLNSGLADMYRDTFTLQEKKL